MFDFGQERTGVFCQGSGSDNKGFRLKEVRWMLEGGEGRNVHHSWRRSRLGWGGGRGVDG
jgi:hypothetical protein